MAESHTCLSCGLEADGKFGLHRTDGPNRLICGGRVIPTAELLAALEWSDTDSADDLRRRAEAVS